MIDAPTTPAPLPVDARNATARPGEPESIGEILPRVLTDLDRRRRKLTPDQLALLGGDVQELAPPVEDDE